MKLEDGVNLMPEEIMQKSNEARGQLISNKSTGNEDVIMAYVYDLSKKYESSSLWSKFSIIKLMLLVDEDMDISQYPKVRAFLKKQSVKYEPVKSKVLSREEVHRFMVEAPNKEYLLCS